MAQDVLREIESQASTDFSMGRRNHLADLSCSMAAIFASLVAAILAAAAATTCVPVWVTAAVAGIPALCTSLQKVIDFRGRAAWYFKKAAKLKRTALALRYENLPEKKHRRSFARLRQQWRNNGLSLSR
jgi:fatty acid desaturase